MYNISKKDIENIKQAAGRVICGVCENVPVKSNSHLSVDVYTDYGKTKVYMQVVIRMINEVLTSDPAEVKDLHVEDFEGIIETAVKKHYEEKTETTLRNLRVG